MLINLGPEWKDRWVNPTHIISIRLDKDCNEIYIKLSDGEVLKCWINNVEFLAAEFERVLKLINGDDKASETKSEDWISIEEKIPTEGEVVLFCYVGANASSSARTGWFIDKGNRLPGEILMNCIDRQVHSCNYWKQIPLPPFPKGQS